MSDAELSFERSAPSQNRTSSHSLSGHWQIVLLVSVLAIALRCSLGIVNREANDNHYEVVKLILEGRSGLTMNDCHECFHPKFFYHFCAWTCRAFGLESESSRIVGGQLLNSLAGVITLAFVFFALNSLRVSPVWRLWTFALIALNPRFIAINGQLSNDSFAILFATGATFLTLNVLKSPSVSMLALTQLVLTCALMTKGTTWVVAIAMSIIFVVRALLDESKLHARFFVSGAIVTVINSFVSIQLAGYDFDHYDAYANMGRGQPLYIWEKTNVGQPGVQSIVDGYFTFRFVDLLDNPQITGKTEVEQLHRTSVWTQLFARANFAQFERHPRSWQTSDPAVLFIARCSFVLGLAPLLFLCIGLIKSCLRSLRAWQSWGVPPQSDYASLFGLLLCLGYLAFIIKFTADYRDFAAMKLIYILPGVLPFALVLLEGMEASFDRMRSIKYMKYISHGVLGMLVAFHAIGMLALVGQLAGV